MQCIDAAVLACRAPSTIKLRYLTTTGGRVTFTQAAENPDITGSLQKLCSLLSYARLTAYG